MGVLGLFLFFIGSIVAWVTWEKGGGVGSVWGGVGMVILGLILLVVDSNMKEAAKQRKRERELDEWKRQHPGQY